ncbi:hypothetical protein BURMUCF2_1828 [Burkholderia multivorans CF2]|nr:hypothetical protein BURMUCF2_1828 [Burkholderia multivorans CF2]
MEPIIDGRDPPKMAESINKPTLGLFVNVVIFVEGNQDRQGLWPCSMSSTTTFSTR